MEAGTAILVDAHGGDPERLRSPEALGSVFDALVADLDLHPLGETRWHRFPAPGGVTGFVVLSESHLACHTFPETGFAAFDLYCCRVLPDWPWEERLRELLGVSEVRVVRVPRGRLREAVP